MDTVQLDFARGRVNLSCREVTLRAGAGAHALVVRVEVRASWLPEKGETPVEPLLICAEVSIDDRNTWVGATQPAVWQLYGFSNASGELVITLTDEQLLAVERQRGDRDLTLRVKVHGSLLVTTPTPQAPRQVDMPVRVSRETWLQQLNNAGVEVGILLRIRSPLTDRGLTPASGEPESVARVSRVTTQLAQAKQALLDHAWEQSVLHCRKALEVLEDLAPVTESEVRCAAFYRGTGQSRSAGRPFFTPRSASSTHRRTPMTTPPRSAGSARTPRRPSRSQGLS